MVFRLSPWYTLPFTAFDPLYMHKVKSAAHKRTYSIFIGCVEFLLCIAHGRFLAITKAQGLQMNFLQNWVFKLSIFVCIRLHFCVYLMHSVVAIICNGSFRKGFMCQQYEGMCFIVALNLLYVELVVFEYFLLLPLSSCYFFIFSHSVALFHSLFNSYTFFSLQYTILHYHATPLIFYLSKLSS